MIIPGLQAAVAELADALDSKSSGSNRAGSSPASGIRFSPEVFPALPGIFLCKETTKRIFMKI